MSKRRREQEHFTLPFSKRLRESAGIPIDRLSSLSNELLLHILSFLPISSLSVCQRLSRRFHALSGDSELWKRQYYTQWVRPRARRLASVRRSTLPTRTEYSPKVSTWLDHGHLAEEGKVTNWKGQYRLRHNWSRGTCRFREVELPPQPFPPVLAKLCGAFVFTADSTHGLRAWAAREPEICLAKASFSGQAGSSEMLPTALAVSHSEDSQEIVVGFENGHFHRYIMNTETSQLVLQSSDSSSSSGAITAMALSSPYLLMVSQNKILSLHTLQTGPRGPETPGGAESSRELASLKADNMVAPMTLCLRKSTLDIVATVVYSFFHIGCGWSLGIQELRFDKTGRQLESRLTSTVDSQYGIRPLQGMLPSATRRISTTTGQIGDGGATVPTTAAILHKQPPTSMSYSHPYLLTSHADNTLTMYLVVSNSDSLFVRGGQRLWGHTSSVSTVQVKNRGKAVSVSSRGNEVRVWELETAVPSLGTRRPLREESSIQINPENKRENCRTEAGDLDASSDNSREMSCGRECIGFDEERVFLLRERTIGTQLLECYDFT
ncbi:hypothetical protein N7532_009086 [Penicillium argentinense]|uniref:Probable E3 ubiquitin ligase complex SCF subunit sconB n=1 Tax=Penicillium argentinense TaxID=1131581 RepID=A0A9W9EYK9_9EURO|nr:uncharacterized protein N7532_009086 [Penicillium argentinense]KAJ5090402.1 hypothetical protein N7532_009086 [Penicillium argentinense]